MDQACGIAIKPAQSGTADELRGFALSDLLFQSSAVGVGDVMDRIRFNGVRAVHGRCVRRLLFQQFCIGLAASMLAGGLVVLIWRAGFGGDSLPLLPIACVGVAVACVIANVRARSRWPSRDAMAALIDGHAQAGGRLMHAVETRGQPAAPPAASPAAPGVEGLGRTLRVTWPARRVLGTASAGICFFAAAALVPMHNAQAAGGTQQLGSGIERIKRDADVLAQAEVIDPVQQQAVEQAIDQIEQRADADSPGETWQAIDRLDAAIDRLAQDGLRMTADSSHAAGGAEALAEMLARPAADLPDGMMDAIAQAIPEIQEMLGSGELASELAEALEQASDASLTDEQRAEAAKKAQELAKQLGEARANSAQQLGEARLVSEREMKASQQARELARQQLRQFIRECDSAGTCLGGQQALLMQLARGVGRKTAMLGSGGVNRGPGAMATNFHDTVPAVDTTGQPTERLDGTPEVEGSQITGFGRSSQDGELGTASAGGAIDGTNAGSAAGPAAAALPRHRDAIRAYFDRAPSKASEQQPKAVPSDG